MARRALGPATLVVVRALTQELAARDSALLVACSGGADSLALAAAAVQVGRRQQLPVAAVVVDHGLQEDSAEVAAGARQQLVGLGVSDAWVTRVVVERRAGTGPEAAARVARYDALERAAAPRGATVLLGHTMDDQAETVLLGLARGSGARSLAGMPTRSGRYLRPLLGLRRTVSDQVCAEHELVPWRDPHNEDDAYARPRVRSRVLPLLESELGPGVVESLSRTARLARDDADLLDHLAGEAYPLAVTLECARLVELPAALRRRVIHRWLLARGAAEVGLVHVLRVEELVTGWHGQLGADLPGVRVTREADRLVCGPGAGVAG